MGSEQPVVLLTPRVPPNKNGVGDYTYHLGKELAKNCPVRIVTTRGEREERGGDAFHVLPVVPGWNLTGTARLSAVLEQLRPRFVNVQWVPHLWGKRGLNFALPLRLLWLRWKGYRVVTTVHEPYVPFDSCRHVVAGACQRLALWLVILASAKVAVTTQAWTEMFRRFFPWKRDDIFWLPVGSNIPSAPVSPAERERFHTGAGLDGAGLVAAVVNPLGAGKMVDLIYQAWDAIRRRHQNAKLVMLGCRLDEMRARLPRAAGADGGVYTGYLDPAEMARWLSCVDLILVPFVDGVSARRTSVITAMEHGVPVVTTRGRLTERELFDGGPLVLADVDDRDGFVEACLELAADEGGRAELREAGRRFYQIHFSWTTIAQQLLRACG